MAGTMHPGQQAATVADARLVLGVAVRESNPGLGSYPMRLLCANSHIWFVESAGVGARGAC